MTAQTILPPTGSKQEAKDIVLPYGSVLRRFVAMVLDRLIVNIAVYVLLIPLGLVASLGSALLTPQLGLFEGVNASSAWVLIFIADWLYFAIQESSDRGATLGKRLMRLRVVDETGGKIYFSRASARYFCKILSALPLMLGFVMAFFMRKKQALHDMIAETVVIRA